jgi:GTP-binding protein EngB required for normal cell division
MGERINETDKRVSDRVAESFTAYDLSEVLNRLESLTSGEELTREKKRVQDIRQRLSESRFHLAVLGQFKRGKTTLLNALLGEALLPSAVVPVTSVPTLISGGNEIKIRIIFQGERVDEHRPEDIPIAAKLLEKYVSEQGNPGNCLQVQRVEVEYPSPLLAKGVVLIDTPGIGSTLKHNTDATLDFLSQCDAALFMVSADPPITQAEIEFLRAVRPKVAQIFFLLNKIDYLGESDLQTAEEFLKQTLLKQGGLSLNEPVFSISARQGLEARIKQDEILWQKSGLAKVEAYLLQFLALEKTRTLNIAIAKKAKDVADDILTRLRLEERALSLPLNELQQRLTLFDEKLKEANHQHLILQDLLTGELRRSRESLEEKAAAVYKQTHGLMVSAIGEILGGPGNPEALEKAARSRLAQIVSEIFGTSLDKTSQEMKELVERSLKIHQDQAASLITFVRQNAAELFEIPFIPPDGTITMEMGMKPYFVSERWDCTLSLVPEGAINRLLPRDRRIRRLRKQLEEDAESIALRNVGNLQWALKQNLEDTFRNFSSEIEQRLQEALEITRGAIEAVHQRRMERATSLGPELGKVQANTAELGALQTLLTEIETHLQGES